MRWQVDEPTSCQDPTLRMELGSHCSVASDGIRVEREKLLLRITCNATRSSCAAAAARNGELVYIKRDAAMFLAYPLSCLNLQSNG
jgi:hypothetical protein